MSEAFIKHVLGVGTDHPGLYGDTDAYYGTVEQQGRLTLHMHMLIWIKSALSPQEIRERILDPDSRFQKDMISYLEACHVGEFLTGTMADIKAKVPYHNKARQDPTQTLPTAPPPVCLDCKEPMCENCENLKNWWSDYEETVDDLILRSNVHTCRRPVAEVRGCIRKDGTCASRFPRDIFPKTEVDREDGYINMKKLEPMINCVTPDVTYCLRCNTDVTSLLSGTSIKAVVAYISDYVTKATLKLYHIFDTVAAVLNRDTEVLWLLCTSWATLTITLT
ncbi:hypothetical protein C8R43DRAFT_1092757 [Mycena crocata]|nr:hypothetical protein C8R43DRAFT_1092757 [Mycena crocata]